MGRVTWWMVCLPNDFSVFEDGKKQDLKFFTSDPFPLSAAVILDTGMPDTAVQKINQTYSSLSGAFSPYDEVSLYTYSTTVSQVSDFSSAGQKLTSVLNQMKLERGRQQWRARDERAARSAGTDGERDSG